MLLSMLTGEGLPVGDEVMELRAVPPAFRAVDENNSRGRTRIDANPNWLILVRFRPRASAAYYFAIKFTRSTLERRATPASKRSKAI